jgi:hypothetical protein
METARVFLCLNAAAASFRRLLTQEGLACALRVCVLPSHPGPFYFWRS